MTLTTVQIIKLLDKYCVIDDFNERFTANNAEEFEKAVPRMMKLYVNKMPKFYQKIRELLLLSDDSAHEDLLGDLLNICM